MMSKSIQLYLVSILFGVIPLLGEFILFYESKEFNPTFIIALGMGVILLTNLSIFYLHRNQSLALVITCCTIVGAVSYAIVSDGGFHSPLVRFLILIVVGCSILLGKWGAAGSGFYSIGFILYQYNMVEQAARTQEILSLISSILIMSLVCIFLEKTREQSRIKSVQLEKLNSELRDMASLSRHQLNNCMRTGKVSVWMLDLESDLVSISENFVNNLGTADIQTPIAFSDFVASFHPKDQNTFTQFIDTILRHKTIHEGIEIRSLNKENGRESTYIMRCSFDEKKGKNRVLGSLIEISDLKAVINELEAKNNELIEAVLRATKSEAEVEKRNQEVEQFVYTVSHDLKTPVVTTMGFLKYLEEDLDTLNIKRAKSSLVRIKAAGKKMGELLEDLLNFSQLGYLELQTEEVDIDLVITSIISKIKEEPLQKTVTFKKNESLGQVRGDLKGITQVFENLIRNGIKYTNKEQVEIEIGRQDSEDKKVYYVKDLGIGINSDYFKKIFELFQRLDPRIPGSGVGLAIVSKLMSAHDGHVWVESTLGKGATFYVSFPKNHSKSTL